MHRCRCATSGSTPGARCLSSKLPPHKSRPDQPLRMHQTRQYLRFLGAQGRSVSELCTHDPPGRANSQNRCNAQLHAHATDQGPTNPALMDETFHVPLLQSQVCEFLNPPPPQPAAPSRPDKPPWTDWLARRCFPPPGVWTFLPSCLDGAGDLKNNGWP